MKRIAPPCFPRSTGPSPDRKPRPAAMKSLPNHCLRLLSLSLLALALAGCGASGTDSGGTSENQSPAAAADPPEPAPPARETETLRRELAEYFALIREDRSGPARVRIRKHLNLHPDDGQAHFLFGLSYHREKQYAEAEPYFADGRRLAPNFPPVHYFSGWCAYYRGALDEARPHFERYLALEPEVSDAWFALGLIAYDEDRPADAEAAFAHALDAVRDDDPQRGRQRSKIHARWAELVIDEGDLPRARTMLESSVAEFPDQYDAWFRLARLLDRLGEPDAADAARRSGQDAQTRVQGTAGG